MVLQEVGRLSNDDDDDDGSKKVDKTMNLRPFFASKKCTKKRDARAELLLCT